MSYLQPGTAELREESYTAFPRDTLAAVRIWEQLGPHGRLALSETDMLPERHARDVLLIASVETMTCVAHPLERLAGCSLKCCSGKTVSLQSKQALTSCMTTAHHAAPLLQIFLKDPLLAYPPDIPQYALRAEKHLIEYNKLVRMRKERQARRAAAEARRAAKKAAAAAVRASYAYRIAQTRKKLEKIGNEVDRAIALRSRIEKRRGRATRSLNALIRAAKKKGESIEL